jgi:hypothetical protein
MHSVHLRPAPSLQLRALVHYSDHPLHLCNPIFTLMPRERGKPRRGSAWYTHAAQRQRLQQMERALSLARTHLRRRENEARLPPMAYVEDIFPEEPVQAPPEHLLFTVPDNWQPTSHFLEKDTSTASEKQPGSNIGAENCDDFPICYIEEEYRKKWSHRRPQPRLDTPWTQGREAVRMKEQAENNKGMQSQVRPRRTGWKALQGRVARSCRHLPFHPCMSSGMPHHLSSTRSTWNSCSICGDRWRTMSTVSS